MTPEQHRLLSLAERHERTAAYWRWRGKRCKRRLIVKHTNKARKLINKVAEDKS